MVDFKLNVLSNGLRVITTPMDDLPSASVLVLVGAGSRYEQKNKAGLSHFLEHMIFKGTKKRPSAFEISSLVDSVGGMNNAFTGKDHTGFYLKLQKTHLELAFDLLSDTLRNSLFDQIEIDRERGTILEEINMYEDTPMYDIDEVFYNLMFDGHPLGWSIAGDKKTVCNIQRPDFIDYTKRFYQGSDMVLAVSGGIDPIEVKSLSEKYFSCFDKGEKEKIVEFKEDQNKPRLKIKHKKTDQCHLYLGFPSFSFLDPDKTALSVLSAILGGGMSSRLFIEVRERRGLAYYVRCVTDFHHETGYLAARAGVNISKAGEAVKVILEVFDQVKNGQVTEEELGKAKEYIKGHVALDMEDSLEVAMWYGRHLLLQETTETPQQIFDKIDKVNLEDIKRVCDRVMNNQKINLAMIGPLKEEDSFFKIIS